MPNWKAVTLAFHNLPTTATQRSLEDYVGRVVPNSTPVASMLVREVDAPLDSPQQKLCSTVRLRVDVGRLAPNLRSVVESCKRDIAAKPFFAGTQSSVPAVDIDFEGVTPLYEHHEESDIDIFILHGLGGHAYKSFEHSTDSADPVTGRNWAQHFLPEYLEEKGIRARISTIGYNARFAGRVDPNAKLPSVAWDILMKLEGDAFASRKRPMIFICHSLGGIVLCQTMISALHCDNNRKDVEWPEVTDFFKQSDGSPRVKGITFLGTPFDGSLTAGRARIFFNVIATPLNLLPTNLNLLQTLSRGNPELHAIAGRFLNVVETHRIPLSIGYESTPTNGQLVVPESSATSVFKHSPFVKTLRLSYVNHREMIKYFEPDGNYKAIAQGIAGHISLAGYPTVPDGEHGGPSLRRRGTVPAPVHNSTETSLPSRSSTYPYPPIQNNISIYMSREGQLTFGEAPQAPGVGTGTTNGFDSPENPEDLADIQVDRSLMKDGKPLARLRRYDTVYVIDDTASMEAVFDSRRGVTSAKSRWDVMTSFVTCSVGLATKLDRDGVDAYFLVHGEEEFDGETYNMTRVKDGKTILNKLRLLKLFLSNNGDSDDESGTYFKDTLEEIIDPKINQLRQHIEAKKRRVDRSQKLTPPKPLNIIVVTDGAADDQTDVEDYILKVAKELDNLDADKHFIGIQFLQVGDDKDATEWLVKLDNELGKENGIRVVRDIVDTFPWKGDYRGQDLQQALLKATLGAIDDKWDSKDPTFATSQSSPVSPPTSAQSPSTIGSPGSSTSRDRLDRSPPTSPEFQEVRPFSMVEETSGGPSNQMAARSNTVK